MYWNSPQFYNILFMQFKATSTILILTTIFALATSNVLLTTILEKLNLNGCKSDEILTKQRGCIKSCKSPDYKNCPDVFIAIYDPKFCGLRTDGTWFSYTFDCQACKSSDVIGVTNGTCQSTDKPIVDLPIQSSSCKKDSDCKSYEFCDILNYRCLDRCALARCAYGCVQGACLPQPQPTCKSDADCPIEQNCQNGQCINLCALTLCLAPSQCYKGKCYAADYCFNDKQCKTGEVCDNGKCINKQLCEKSVCTINEICVLGKCIPNPIDSTCLLLNRCKANEICSYGLCINKCALIKCSAGYECVDGKCVPELRKCKDNSDCGIGERCDAGVCKDKCWNVKCPVGTFCVQGACVSQKCAKVSCPQGTYCKNGICVPDLLVCPVKPKATVKLCTDPRPTDKTCPVIYYIRAPDPLFCGVKADGTRVNFARDCEACKDKSIVYYFDKPCEESPFICNKQDKCLDYYCSSPGCTTDQKCPYDWQICNSGSCIDRCALMKCAYCKYGECGYDYTLNQSCKTDSDCGKDNWRCQAFKCVNTCINVSCPGSQVCKNGQCA